MSRFLSRLGVFAVLQLGILGGIVLLDPGDNDLRQVTNARHRIAASAPGPRLIINGDSNALTAFDSPFLHEQTGLQPVNMGFGGGLDLEYILNETFDVTRPGDTVLLSLAYEHFAAVNWLEISRSAYVHVVARRPQNLGYVPWKDVPWVLDHLLVGYHYMLRESRRRCMSAHPPQPAVERINSYGDLLPSPHDPVYEVPDMSTVPRLENSASGVNRRVDRLNQFVRDCAQKNVAVYLMYGPCEQHHFDHNREFIDTVHRTLEERFEGVLLSNPEDTVWPPSMFKDAHVHLNARATRTHTERFLELLQASRTGDEVPTPQRVASRAERFDVAPDRERLYRSTVVPIP